MAGKPGRIGRTAVALLFGTSSVGLAAFGGGAPAAAASRKPATSAAAAKATPRPKTTTKAKGAPRQEAGAPSRYRST
jgi:hypothetical protein